MNDSELADLEDEIISAYDTFRGFLAWVPDPYERGLLLRHLDNLSHSANKWLDEAIRQAATGTVHSAASQPRRGRPSKGTLGRTSAGRSSKGAGQGSQPNSSVGVPVKAGYSGLSLSGIGTQIPESRETPTMPNSLDVKETKQE